MEAFPLGDGAELGIVRRNQMRPAGATLGLFAQWLRPTTNTLKANPNRLAFFSYYSLFVRVTADFFYLLPQKLWRQSGPCSDAEFRVSGFDRMAHAVGPRSRRR